MKSIDAVVSIHGLGVGWHPWDDFKEHMGGHWGLISSLIALFVTRVFTINIL